uniref:Uncharacterized protein n=1 Tax=Anguilla anguilla TaxID=7936 RepID=A0A0E9WVJ5_ANGAN
MIIRVYIYHISRGDPGLRVSRQLIKLQNNNCMVLNVFESKCKEVSYMNLIYSIYISHEKHIVVLMVKYFLLK